MRHAYNIEGMTCGGCKASVEEALQSVTGVSEVKVELENGRAEVDMSEMIPLIKLQEKLPTKFSISEENIFTIEGETSEKTKFQQLQPLFLIFGYIVGASVLLNYRNWNTSEVMLDFMGLFYIVFSFFKMLDLKGFQTSFRMYDPLAKAVPVYALIYPFLETVLGLMFLMRFEVTAALIATIVILGITTIGVTRSLLSKKSIQCACLGTALKLPMTQATFIENSVMILMAIFMLLA